MSWLSKVTGRGEPDQEFWDQISPESHIRAIVERFIASKGGEPGAGRKIGQDFVNDNSSTYIKVLMEYLRPHISAQEYAAIFPGDGSMFKGQQFANVCWKHKDVLPQVYATADEHFFELLKKYAESRGQWQPTWMDIKKAGR